MGREKKNPPQAVAGGPKERHKRVPKSSFDPKAPMPTGLVAKPTRPKSTSKHHTYFEFVENKEKKKKLEYQITTKATPPPGFEFVPIGNPELTTACKELSRAKDAMIFIVSNSKEIDPNHLSHHVHRTGHHIRQAIIEESRETLRHVPAAAVSNGQPEPLPKSQAEYTAQANATILDLFPRIPNTDRQSIIMQSFNLAGINQKPKPVGLSTDMPLSRRVQLAVVAHIRHTHTRYDELLKETSWQNARKVVEALCLDIVVKWRGDEETGRDQLDEILREVVVISDSDSEESESEGQDTEDSSLDDVDVARPNERRLAPQSGSQGAPRLQRHPQQGLTRGSDAFSPTKATTEADHPRRLRTAGKKEQRGFKRYRAWEEAIRRNRGNDMQPLAYETHQPVSHGTSQYVGPAGDGLRPRIMAGGPGSVPHPNGLVPRQPQPGPSPLAHFPDAPSSSAFTRPMREQVTSSIREQAPATLSRSRHVTPITDRLQDMLVPSIEPASPDTMQPSFVRTLPPRTHLSPPRRNVHYRPESASPTHELGTRDGPFYVERHVVNDRPPLDMSSQEHNVDAHGHQRTSRFYDPRQPVSHSHLSAPYPHAHQSGVASAPPARRIAVGTGRPGERSNPILMEDRGGFFERVPDHPNTVYPRAPDSEVHQARWPPQDLGRPSETHRVVSWEEGSRILRESRNDRNVEVIPMSGARPLHPEAHQYIAPQDSRPAQLHDPWAPREPHSVNPPGYPHGQAAEPLPPTPDYVVTPPQHGREVPYDHQPSNDARYYQQPVHHGYYGNQQPVHHYYSRQGPNHPHPGGDKVIFLE